MTNGGGPGVLATDALMDLGGRLADLSPETIARLDAVLPKTWSRSNPVDIIGDANGRRYTAALDALLDDCAVDAVVVLNCPTAVGDPMEAARAVIATVEAAGTNRLSGRNIFTSWLGRHSAGSARQLFATAGLSTYETPDEAIRGFMQCVQYRENQDLLRQVPAARSEEERYTPDVEAARRCIRSALAVERTWLDSQEVDVLFAAYGIPTAVLCIARDPTEAAQVASKIGFPVALKIRSPNITHKTDVGGVVLNLASPEQVHQEALAMLQRVRGANPRAELSGFTIQQMVLRPGSIELIVGVSDDKTFGPVVLFGHGGIAVEALSDSTLELPPLNDTLARAQIARTRVWKLLQGIRNRPAADIKMIAETLVRVSQLVTNHAEICELDINPLLADSLGVLALDARVRVRKATMPAAARLAICPYPRDLETKVVLADLTPVQIQPVRPEDEPRLHELVANMTAEELGTWFGEAQDLSEVLAVRLSQIDYDREMVILALSTADAAALGVARYQLDSDRARARFSIFFRPDWKGRGLEAVLMKHLAVAAQSRALATLIGEVPAGSDSILKGALALGFDVQPIPQKPDLVRVTARLQS